MPTTDTSKTTGKKILLIDDDLFIRDLYDEVLTQAGFVVETAANGKTGLEKILAGGYDLILLDVMMPQLDGIAILGELETQQPKLKNGPIVLLTNLAHDPVIKEALKKGAKDCFIKADLNPDEFLTKVQALIQ